MHIVLGFLLAAICIYWWVRGSIILAIAASLPVLLYAAAVHNLPILLALPIVWAPYVVWYAVRHPYIECEGPLSHSARTYARLPKAAKS